MRLTDVKKEIERIELEESRLAELKSAYLTILDLLTPRAEATPENPSDVEAVKFHIDCAQGDFTVDTISKELEDCVLYSPIPKANLSAILSRMAREGKIKVVVRGGGRKASVYRKISNENKTPGEDLNDPDTLP